ncbi:hypothetical protein [Streptomyces rochei]|uniref:hypothetical protein n=1 Tax=Streptomyces rochei TaxID=1928 RepID=UPI00378BABFE
MDTATVEFYGGPFDGQTEHWSVTEQFDVTLTIRPDHDPAVLAIYRLRSITLSTPCRIGYVYHETIVDSAA